MQLVEMCYSTKNLSHIFTCFRMHAGNLRGGAGSTSLCESLNAGGLGCTSLEADGERFERLALERMMYSVHQTTRPVPKQGATGRPSLSIPEDRVLDHQVTPPWVSNSERREGCNCDGVTGGWGEFSR